MTRIIDLTGKRFGRLTVLGIDEKNEKKWIQWLCKCDCGNIKSIHGQSLRRGLTKSCGCYNLEALSKNKSKHKMTNSRLYKIWIDVHTRVFNTKHRSYKWYGAKGVTIYDEWKNSFESFYEWSMNNGYEEHLTLDRIDSNGNYEPSNCRWVTMKKQQNNRSSNRLITYQGETHTSAEWADILGMNYHTLQTRLTRGWSEEKALSTPVKK